MNFITTEEEKEEEEENKQETECPICLDAMGKKNKVITPCGHVFHTTCLIRNVEEVNVLCPCCRRSIVEMIVDVQPIMCNGITYYKDTATNNVYNCNCIIIGSFNTVTKEIVFF